MKKEYKPDLRIVERSNIVQYDTMGYLLRLCIIEYLRGRKKGETEQVWLDSIEQEGDVECKWTKVTQ